MRLSRVTAHNSEVLGRKVKPRDPAWKGLKWDGAVVRTQSTLMLALVGSDAPEDLHLNVPFANPKDDPGLWEGVKYRVRPRGKAVGAELVDGRWYWIRP